LLDGGGLFSDMPTTLQYVVRNKHAIGFILSAGPKGYRADQDGLPIRNSLGTVGQRPRLRADAPRQVGLLRLAH
jgi:hypothetical protein